MRRVTAVTLALCVLACLAASAVRAGDAPIEKRWQNARVHVVLVMDTSDYGPGDVRVSFLIIDHDGRSLTAPAARLSLAKGPKEPSFLNGSARLEEIGVPAGNPQPGGKAQRGGKAQAGDVTQLFVGHLRIPAPGTYWLLAELEGRSVAGLANVIVRQHPYAPTVGAPAPASRTPTLATTKDIAVLTTRTPPDRELLRLSVADALRQHRPFVVVFATPKFCRSRTCGPVVDIVDAVRKRYIGTPLGFIHVEIYKDNVPSKGPNRWALAWGLPSEPWTFLVGRDGRVKARIEGAFSLGELTASITQRLGVAAPARG